ncbi:hypothetical protein WJX84_008860 [Apatococcus fuscideae]|uniref:UspA domain-containing protein n=1 Tax=Apatococcus fuscideae TaxID=2026836 RepID=A0AAW1SVQ2_9CHLO
MSKLGHRTLLVAVDQPEGSVLVLDWTLKHIYREGDTVLFLHVLPASQGRPGRGSSFHSSDPHHEELLTENVRSTMQDRLVEHAASVGAHPQVSIVKGEGGDADSIGDIICRKAEETQAALVVMAAHTKGSPQERHAVGAVTRYCTRHCTSTVLVMQQP